MTALHVQFGLRQGTERMPYCAGATDLLCTTPSPSLGQQVTSVPCNRMRVRVQWVSSFVTHLRTHFHSYMHFLSRSVSGSISRSRPLRQRTVCHSCSQASLVMQPLLLLQGMSQVTDRRCANFAYYLAFQVCSRGIKLKGFVGKWSCSVSNTCP